MSYPNLRHLVPPRARNERGLSMLELTIMLGALVIISAALTPAVLRMIHQSRQNSVQEEVELLHAAILGSDGLATFGYVGDLGRLPYELSELVVRDDQPLFAVSPISGVGYGWNGPYTNQGRDAQDFQLDPWGNLYDIGVVGKGQIRSAGPDGIYESADDIVYPPHPVNIYGTLIVTVKGTSDSVVSIDPDTCSVTLHYSNDGTASSVVDDTVPYSFSDIHRGLHTLQVSCDRLDGSGIASETAVVTVRGNGAQQAVELFVDLGVAAGTAPATGSATTDPSADTTSTEEGPHGG